MPGCYRKKWVMGCLGCGSARGLQCDNGNIAENLASDASCQCLLEHFFGVLLTRVCKQSLKAILKCLNETLNFSVLRMCIRSSNLHSNPTRMQISLQMATTKLISAIHVNRDHTIAGFSFPQVLNLVINRKNITFSR